MNQQEALNKDMTPESVESVVVSSEEIPSSSVQESKQSEKQSGLINFQRLSELINLEVLKKFFQKQTLILVTGLLIVTLMMHLFSPSTPHVSQARRGHHNQEVYKAVLQASDRSEKVALDFATRQLDDWMDRLEPRVEHFLDWYYDYFTQLGLEFDAVFSSLTGQDASEQVTNKAKREFARLVISPQLEQKTLERIAEQTAMKYAQQFDHELVAIKDSYHLSDFEWDRSLRELALIVNPENSTDGVLSHAISKRIPVVLGTGFTLRLATKFGSTLIKEGLASLSVNTLKSTLYGAFAELGPIEIPFIVISEAWDHHRRVTVEKPALREHILDYFGEMKYALLTDSDSGVMAVIHQVDKQLQSELGKSLSVAF